MSLWYTIVDWRLFCAADMFAEIGLTGDCGR